MNTNADSPISVFELINAVRRNPQYFFRWLLYLLAFVAVVYIIVPRKYFSDGKLFVQVGRSSVGTDPTTSSGTVSLQDSRETEVKSVVTMLESREIANSVVDRVGAERILKPVSLVGKLFDQLS